MSPSPHIDYVEKQRFHINLRATPPMSPFPCWNNLSMKPLQGPHTPRRTARNDGRAPGKGRFAEDVEDDRLSPWRENGLIKRAKVMDRTAPPWKDVMRPGSDEKIK